ncbi:5-dehydro-4-deoxy-D-glucuronate isomerase [soil metagenome]
MIDSRAATDPVSMETATMNALRERYVVDSLFVPGEVRGVYTHEDRMLILGAAPAAAPLELGPVDVVNTASLLDGRELGVVNVGTAGAATVDGEVFELGPLDGLYVGRGHGVTFNGDGARFYCVSALAHRECPTVRVTRDDVEPMLLGSGEGASRRRLYRYVWNGGHESCQLQLGVTVIEDGSVWNTMPPHRHERRTEVYFYTGLSADARVIHLMGQPGKTRHVILASDEAVISPHWSIHAGAATGPYVFVWAMAGENNDYGDLVPVALESL